MAVNPYFRSSYAGIGDQKLIEDMTIETIRMGGRDMVYVPREKVAYDKLFKEDKLSAFREYYTIEMMIKPESVMGFGGDQEFLGKFGLEIRDEFVVQCAQRRFSYEVSAKRSDISRPREGDLILLPFIAEGLFEITFCDEKNPFYQGGKLFVYEIKLKRFELGAEKFETGITRIDEYNTFGEMTDIKFDSFIGTFNTGDVVFQDGGWTAVAVVWDEDVRILTVDNVKGELLEGVTVTGGNGSGLFDSRENDVNSTANIANEQNSFINTNDEFLITTEKNPYSS